MHVFRELHPSVDNAVIRKKDLYPLCDIVYVHIYHSSLRSTGNNFYLLVYFFTYAQYLNFSRRNLLIRKFVRYL